MLFRSEGYSHLRDVESLLGSSASPVARWMNLWWVVFGGLMIAFAGGVGVATSGRGWPGVVLAVQIAVFGAMAGVAAGLFPMDAPGAAPSLSGRLHNLSGIGFAAVFLAPAVAMAAFPAGRFPAMFYLSAAAQVVLLIAAVVHVAGPPALAGLWQRTFLTPLYLYLIALAVQLMRLARH